MNSWKLSLILFIGSILITAVLWALGIPFFFLFCVPAAAHSFSRSTAGEALPGVRMGNHRQRELLPL